MSAGRSAEFGDPTANRGEQVRLILIRHGIAEDYSEEGTDDARKLTPEGEKKFKKGAGGLVRLEPEIEKVISSPLIRAVQTAEILVTKLHAHKFKGSEVTLSGRIKEAEKLLPEQLEQLRPSSDPQEFCAWLKAKYRNELSACLAVCGHEPHLSGLCSFLLSGRHENFFEFKRGGAAALDLYIRSSDIKAQLSWFMKPSQLRELA